MTNMTQNQGFTPEQLMAMLQGGASSSGAVTPLQLLQASMNMLMQAERNLHLTKTPVTKVMVILNAT